MHTSEMVQKLMALDDGRWRVANKSKPIDEYYLRDKLKGYVTPQGKEGAKMPPRQWRPKGYTTMKWGYDELHFKDAFQRYLGRGLPSEASREPTEDEKEETSEHPFSSKHPGSSGASAAEDDSSTNSNTYYDANEDAVAADNAHPGHDGMGSPDVDADDLSDQHHASASSQDTDKYGENVDAADAADLGGIYGEGYKKEENDNAAGFPHGPSGRRARKG
jgi:hypothetical protein